MAPAGFAFDSKATKAYAAGNYDEAESRYRTAVQKMSRRGKHDSKLSRALGDLGNTYYMEGKMRSSEGVYRRLITLDEEIYGSDSLSVADDLYCLSRCLRRQNRWLDAEPVLLRVLALRRKNLGECSKDVSRSWLDLAVNYQRQGNFVDAEEACKKAIEIRESLPEHDGHFLGLSLRTYAGLLYQMKRNSEADALIQRADALFQPTNTVSQPDDQDKQNSLPATTDGAAAN